MVPGLSHEHLGCWYTLIKPKIKVIHQKLNWCLDGLSCSRGLTETHACTCLLLLTNSPMCFSSSSTKCPHPGLLQHTKKVDLIWSLGLSASRSLQRSLQRSLVLCFSISFRFTTIPHLLYCQYHMKNAPASTSTNAEQTLHSGQWCILQLDTVSFQVVHKDVHTNFENHFRIHPTTFSTSIFGLLPKPYHYCNCSVKWPPVLQIFTEGQGSCYLSIFWQNLFASVYKIQKGSCCYLKCFFFSGIAQRDVILSSMWSWADISVARQSGTNCSFPELSSIVIWKTI